MSNTFEMQLCNSPYFTLDICLQQLRNSYFCMCDMMSVFCPNRCIVGNAQ